MLSIHDSIAQIYEQTGHPDWAVRERARRSVLPAEACTERGALCEFRAGRYRAGARLRRSPATMRSRATGARAPPRNSRWRRSSAVEPLPDSRERREVRATLARARTSLCGRDRRAAGCVEICARRSVAARRPRHVVLRGARLRAGRRHAVAPYSRVNPDDRSPPDRVRRLATAVAASRRGHTDAAARRGTRLDPIRLPRLALGRAYVQKGEFAEAIPLDRASTRRRPGRQPACATRSRLYRSRTAGEECRPCSNGRRRFSGQPGAERRRSRSGRSRRRSRRQLDS